ncbi:unnamed protein product [Camellia sinensis]
MEVSLFDLDGETRAESGPKPSVSSGFGGLGLEGMVGMEDPVGEGNSPPGEGRRGEISGDNSVNGDESGGLGNNAGAAEIVAIVVAMGGVFCSFLEEEKESEGEAMKAIIMSGGARRNQKDAIQ